MSDIKKSIITGYRFCLKQIILIKQKDPKLSNSISSSLQIQKGKIPLQQSNQLLRYLSQLLQKSLNNQHKSIIKLIRIFTNSSFIVTNQLKFRKQYQDLTQAKQFVKNYYQFKLLGKNDQVFVMGVINKVCDNKPTRKYRTVASYLKSNSSQNDEFAYLKKCSIKFKNDLNLIVNQNSQWKQMYSQLFPNHSEKSMEIVNQFYNKRIILI